MEGDQGTPGDVGEEGKQEYMNSIVEEYDIEEPAYDGFYQD